MTSNSIHILIVDDDPATRFLTKYSLEKYNSVIPLIIHDAIDGALGLQYISAAHTSPDIILLDINMPGMNAVEFLAAYKSLPLSKSQQSAIYILSTEANAFPKAYKEMVKGLFEKPLTQENIEIFLFELCSKG